MRISIGIFSLALLGLLFSAPAQSSDVDNLPVFLDEQTGDEVDMRLAQQDVDVGIPPSEAAAIAKSIVPGAKVVKVKLLPSGVYAVTLKAKGSVTRVLISADDGSIQ